MDRIFRFFTSPAAVFLLGLLLRIGIIGVQFDRLGEDRDAYLGIARQLAHGNGFADPGTGRPTAYRPPVYPLILAGVQWTGAGRMGIAAVHILAGTATVVLTWIAARRLLPPLGAAWFAAILVAVDPLLLQYTSFPMTETVFTFLIIAMLAVRLPGPPASEENQSPSEVANSLRKRNRVDRFRAVAAGGIFGLAALCRPSVLAWGPLLTIWWLWKTVWQEHFTIRRTWREIPWLTIVAAAVILAPWLIRNTLVFHKPIVTTTHGGYTLLLGNNPVFYREVVAQPWGTVWGGESLAAWQRSLEIQMRQEMPPIEGEIARDRWMYDRAWENIAEQPRMFVRACVLRFLRFWNVAPLAPASAGLPSIAGTLIAVFYVFVTLGFLWGLVRLSRPEWRNWAPLVLLIVAFTAIHLVYWTNMRMRAPVVPMIALLSARGWFDCVSRQTDLQN